MTLIVSIVALLGLAIGSFINAVVWRIKTRRKIIGLKTRSICPHCKHKLSSWDLVPVLSWLALRSRCRYCGKPISIQYPVVELLTAGLFVWSYLAWDFSQNFDAIRFGFWLLLLTGLIILAIYDLKWMILPNRALKPLIIIALLQVVIVFVFGPSKRIGFEHIVAALLAGGFFYSLFAVSKGRWMGGGDVKLAFLMGLILVARDTLVAFVLAFNLAAFLSIALIISRRLSRKSLIPFGPFLITATFIAQLYGQEIFQAYLNLVTIY
jgi:prepilin signal peptidase PulO-like enzyme (type II secretory pathway)